MIRKECEDINEKIYKELVIPFNNCVEKYIKDNIINEFVSFYIATAYKMDILTINDLLNIFSEATEALCQTIKDYCDKEIIKEILETKYKLRIINEYPITIEELDNEEN